MQSCKMEDIEYVEGVAKRLRNKSSTLTAETQEHAVEILAFMHIHTKLQAMYAPNSLWNFYHAV